MKFESMFKCLSISHLKAVSCERLVDASDINNLTACLHNFLKFSKEYKRAMAMAYLLLMCVLATDGNTFRK